MVEKVEQVENLEQKGLPWKYLLLMASVTFMAILSELVPSGILPEMSGALNVSYSMIGLLVSVYAIASAVGTIPLITLTMQVNRRKLLTILMLGFGFSNLVIAFSSSYAITAVARLMGGVCAGVLWPMVSAYAMKLVPAQSQGRAIAITMSGCTLGLGIGLPIMTTIGTKISWRLEFIVMAGIILLIALLARTMLPSVDGEKRNKTNSPLHIIKNKSVVICLVVTLLTIMAHYALYTYISPLVESMNFVGGIQVASIVFGIGTIVSVFIAAKVVDSHLGALNLFMLVLAAVTMVIFLIFKGTPGVAHVAFFLWGVSFGALVTIFQAAVTRQVKSGKDVATSLQSSTFNFGIVIGSAMGAAILDKTSVFYIVIATLALLIIPIVFSIFAKKTFFHPTEK
ncbi:MAG: MFS transporter [Oscillospiraceae bacterium]